MKERSFQGHQVVGVRVYSKHRPPSELAELTAELQALDVRRAELMKEIRARMIAAAEVVKIEPQRAPTGAGGRRAKVEFDLD